MADTSTPSAGADDDFGVCFEAVMVIIKKLDSLSPEHRMRVLSTVNVFYDGDKPRGWLDRSDHD